MQVNLAPTARIYSLSGKVLTEGDLAKLTDGLTTSSGISVSSETLDVVCDLTTPYDISTVKYYRNIATTEQVILYGRQNDRAEWLELASPSNTSNYLEKDLDADENKYQYVRVSHTVIAGISTAFELEIWADDSILYGVGGNDTSHAVAAGVSNPDPSPAAIFNPDIIEHDFFCLLEPSGVDVSGLSVGTMEFGPFYKLYEAGISLPSIYPFSAGHSINLTEISNTLRLAASTSGTYYTPVFDIDGLEGVRLFWKATVSGTSEIDIFSSVDSLPVVSIRASSTAPTDTWSPGQLSTDGKWSIVSGTLPFVSTANNQLLNKDPLRYWQARVEFHSPSIGQTPILEKIGFEVGQKVVIGPTSHQNVYLLFDEADPTTHGVEVNLIVWYFETRT